MSIFHPLNISKIRITLFLIAFLSVSGAIHAKPISDYGAVCDGVTDDINAFDAAWQDMVSGNTSVLQIEGRCHLSKPWMLHSNISTYQPKLIEGWGAVVDNTIVLFATGVSLKGVSVRNSPKDGFAFLRGQGSSHERLHAENNGRHGFYFGIDNGNYGFNSQVTNSVFTLFSSIGNAVDGFHWDGQANHNRSWLNANTFLHPVSRDNGRNGWNTVPGTGPTGLVSQSNYNTFIGAQFERNGQIPNFETTRASTFIGSHIADTNSMGESLIPGTFSYILGGRTSGDIRNKNTDNTILINSSTPGEGAHLHYLRYMDSID